MIFDIIRAIFQTSISLSYICYQQVLDQTLGILIEVSWELDFTFQNLLINCHGVIIVEWIDSRYHLVSQNAKCPPIHRLSMTLIK